MASGLAVILALVLFLFMLSRMRLNISLYLRRQGSDDQIVVTVWTLWKLVRYRLEMPLFRLVDEGIVPWVEYETTDRADWADESAGDKEAFRADHLQRWRTLVGFVRSYSQAYRRWSRIALRDARLESVRWRSRFGHEDAATTAAAYGLAWILASIVLRRLAGRVALVSKPEVVVVADYSRAGLEFEFGCILRLRLGNVINATVDMIKRTR